MREPPNIPQERLRACLREHYSFGPVTLEFLPVGKDYRAGIYRVVSARGEPYLLKATSRPLYEPAYLVPRYLYAQGIAAVVVPLSTRSGALWAKLAEWTVIVYPLLDGETGWTGMTPEQWREAGRIFRRIHQAQAPTVTPQAPETAASPSAYASLHKEAFDPTGYVQWVRAFEAEHLHAPPGESASAHALRATWLAHQSTIDTVMHSLESLAPVLQSRTFPSVICHADLHPANLLRDRTGHVFVLDWDEVMLAPKERDFIFIREPPADAFWEGYGRCAIDWVALTYFQWERVAQDLIECARDVLLRDDLGEDTRAEEARNFADQFAPGGNVDAAYAAAAYLPADLRLPLIAEQGAG